MNQHGAGFTLLEVLIALAILAISLAAAVKGISSYANNATYLRDRTLAHWVAMNQVAEYQLQKEWPQIGKREGAATQAGFEWRWRAIVSQTVDKDLRRLDVEVRTHKNDTDAIAIATAFLGRPRLTP
ncbi:general secretion pathway protein I [Gammaproteobacteria bacterium]